MMSISVLDGPTCKSILFEVLDGIPPSSSESQEAIRFREKIENNESNLLSIAQELGLGNPLIEFSSSGEV